MFSFITKNWRGRPLTSYRTIVELIAATTTETGLKIRSARDDGYYPRGVKITDAELAAVPLTPHDWHGEWNYRISPDHPRVNRGVDPNRLAQAAALSRRGSCLGWGHPWEMMTARRRWREDEPHVSRRGGPCMSMIATEWGTGQVCDAPAADVGQLGQLSQPGGGDHAGFVDDDRGTHRKVVAVVGRPVEAMFDQQLVQRVGYQPGLGAEHIGGGG